MLVAGTGGPADAQTTPPVQGTVATEGTMKAFYKAANTIVVATVDGVEHAYRFTKDLVVHGGKSPGVEALDGLRPGTTVVVHYNVTGGEPAAREVDVIGGQGLEVTEGTVTRVDRGRKQITVRYDGGKTETFRLTDRAAREEAADLDKSPEGAKVAIYYADDHGQKVAHYFRRVSKQPAGKS
jgi:hypothetical protein